MRISKTNRHLAIYLISVLALITWVIMQTPGFAPTAAYSSKQPIAAQGKSQGSAGALTKGQMSARLDELGALINTLKIEVANNPKNASLLAQLDAAMKELREISELMGGDGPAPLAGGKLPVQGETERPQGGVTAPPGCTPSTVTFTQSTPTAIPTGPAVVTSTVVVSGADTFLFDLNLTTNLTHTFAADLDITITSPAGTVVTLTTDNGAGNDNTFNGTVWDDDANPAGTVPYTTNAGLVTDHPYVNLTTATPLVPEEAMSAFIGEDPNGTWTITISDDLTGDSGSLDSWSLNITTATCASPCTLTCPANITASNDTNQCGAVVTYAAPTTTGTCGTVTCSPASGSFFPVGTTTVTCTEAGPPPRGTGAPASCTFTVTVNDTQPPSIICPTNVAAVAAPACPAPIATVATFTTPAATDNCPGATVACVPPSGSSFPAGTTTVTCTTTDASGNTATCSFSLKVFNVCVQDRSNPAAVLAWNTSTGDYVFCCNGTTFTGIGKVKQTGCTYTLEHTAVDRRVTGKVDFTTFRGEGALQSPVGTIRCTISDNDVRNNDCSCIGGAAPPPSRATTK